MDEKLEQLRKGVQKEYEAFKEKMLNADRNYIFYQAYSIACMNEINYFLEDSYIEDYLDEEQIDMLLEYDGKILNEIYEFYMGGNPRNIFSYEGITDLIFDFLGI